MGLKESGLRGSLRNVGSVTPAFFQIDITSTNSPVTKGDTLEVDYLVDNTGDKRDVQDVFLEIDSVEEDRDNNIELFGGASATGTLFWDTTGEAATDYTASVFTDDDSDTVTVTVESPIPDTTEYQFVAEDLSSGSDDWVDRQNGETLSAVNSPTLESSGFNGKPSVYYNGSTGHGSSSITTALSQPFSIVAAIEFISAPSSDNDVMISFRSSDLGAVYWDTDGDGWSVWAGSGLRSGDTTAYQQTSYVIDGTNSAVRGEGSDLTTGDSGTRDQDAIGLGFDISSGNPNAKCRIAEVLFINGSDPGDIADAENYLISKYGI